MQTFPYQIDYYVAADGRVPFKDWLEKLRDVQGRAKVRVRLDRVRLGNLGDHRPVGDGVLELRIDCGPGYRVYFALDGQSLVLLLFGGDKGSQVKDIARAKEFWRDYQKGNRS